MPEELTLDPALIVQGYRLTVSDSEQFSGNVQDFDVWLNDQHLKTFEAELDARTFITQSSQT